MKARMWRLVLKVSKLVHGQMRPDGRPKPPGPPRSWQRKLKSGEGSPRALTSTLCEQKFSCNGDHDRIFTCNPLPIFIDVQKRIQELCGFLDPNNPHYQPEQQHN